MKYTPGKRDRYPWESLRVGDAFEVYIDDPMKLITQRNSFYSLAARKNFKVSVKKVPGGLRIERVG